MTYNEFLYWLQGFVELSDAEALSNSQAHVVLAHVTLARETEKELADLDALEATEYIAGMLNLHHYYDTQTRRICLSQIKARLGLHFTKVTPDVKAESIYGNPQGMGIMSCSLDVRGWDTSSLDSGVSFDPTPSTGGIWGGGGTRFCSPSSIATGVKLCTSC